MTNEELKEALIKGQLVTYRGYRYRLMTVYYRVIDGRLSVGAELASINGSSSLIYARAKEVDII